MSTPAALVQAAFERLSERAGFIDRPGQIQLALLISDLIEGNQTGIFEAPTGLGKSLAALVPAIANSIVHGKRTVVATYTNVLAEQYWRNDLPLALSLFDDSEIELPKSQLLMGRQRYVCLISLDEHAPDLTDFIRMQAKIGNESEFKRLAGMPQRQAAALWPKVAVAPVCAGVTCPLYDDCFYYNARRSAEKAGIVITNHSVVIQDAVMADPESGQGMLGAFDFLILDEAHDFPQAAQNGLEFELSPSKLSGLAAISHRLQSSLAPIAEMAGEAPVWMEICTAFRDEVAGLEKDLGIFGLELNRPGILEASPSDLLAHPHVSANRTPEAIPHARELAKTIARCCSDFSEQIQECIDRWKETEPERTRRAADSARNYRSYIQEFGGSVNALFEPRGVAVTYAGRSGADAMLRQDVISLAEPLRTLIWERTPYVCMSATAALDGNFEFFKRVTGAQPAFEEILESPFDYSTQAVLYLPEKGSIPDPTEARRSGREDEYYRSMARELSKIIRACGGRTLALFHSRKEMDGVYSYMNLPPELKLYTQTRQNAAGAGERFLLEVESSLFALRSFWTGFDAPGETLSCVALVRVPFEVPVEPPQIARLAFLQQQGLDAFGEYTLPLAKMLMRQGLGRLIRRDSDKGVVAILDPRVQTKRYGADILNNLPTSMRMFHDIDEAVGAIGLTVDGLLC